VRRISWINFQTIQQVLIAPLAVRERGFRGISICSKFCGCPKPATLAKGWGAIRNRIFPFINRPRVMPVSQLVCQSVRSWSMPTIFMGFVIVLQGMRPPLGARNRLRFDRANCQRAAIRHLNPPKSEIRNPKSANC